MTYGLEFDKDALPEALVAHLEGDVDMAVTGDLTAALLAAVERHGPGCLVIDLGSVDYMDSSGIELLFRLHAATTGHAVDLIVVAPPGTNAARLLGLVAMSDIGEVRESLDRALDRCSGRERR
jgi:anti-anti-sigma factor